MNEKAKAKCAVPDCTRKATRKALISINGAPKKYLPVCRRHADAAKEDEQALEQAIEAASATAEMHMARFIDTLLLGPAGFERGMYDIDTPVWRSKKGMFKLAYVHVTGTAPSNFRLSYNIEYDFHKGPGHHLRGEFDAVTSAQIARTINALRLIY